MARLTFMTRRRTSEMLQLESMRVVNATLKRIKTELEEGKVEDPEELSKLAKEASLAVLDIQIKLDLKN